MENQVRKYLYSHTSPETAYVVEDYPWGFRLRTTIRYWIESKDAKNGGQRFASQTINPKTGGWCAVKYTTYHPLMVMYLDENEHVKCDCLNMHCTDTFLEEFKNTHISNLSEFQKEKLREVIAFNNVMKHVKFEVGPSSVGPVSLFSKDPIEIEKRKQLLEQQEQRKKEREQELKKINRAINYEYTKVVL